MTANTDGESESSGPRDSGGSEGPTEPPPPGSRSRAWAWLALGVVAVVGAVVLLPRNDEDVPVTPAPAAGPRTAGFEDSSEEAGIAFRMQFLPNEQGENFKINLYDHGSGVAVADYDGDGLDDLYFCNQLGGNALYRNVGEGKFRDVTATAGDVALADRISVSAVFADYDRDGAMDLFVTTTRGGNALLRNVGGRFVDVTEAAGVAFVAHSQFATFFDADGDGALDLFVSNSAKWTLEAFDPVSKYYLGPETLLKLIESPPESNRFFRNRGDGTFEDRTEASGLAANGWSGDTAAFDYDEDGDLDLVVANMFGASHLYENDGKGRFTEVTKRVLGRVPWGGVACKAVDYDDDGRLDLFFTDMHSDMWMDPSYEPRLEDAAIKYDSPMGSMKPARLDPESRAVFARLKWSTDDVLFGNALFRALGGGKFEEVSDRAGVETFWPWGIAAEDFDGDGYVDFLIASGMGHPFQYVRSPVLMNRGDGTFTDRAPEAGIDPPPHGAYEPTTFRGKRVARSVRCAATGDFDLDGRPDVVVQSFNGRPWLLMNRWPKRPWVGFRLAGTRGNREAIGAVVRLKVGGKTLTRQVQAAGGYIAQSSLALHFGLGKAERIDDCEITWPGGKKQVLGPVALGTVHRVQEP